MASPSSKTEAETAETAPTTDPIETITESVVSLSLNKEQSDSDPEEDDSFDHDEDSDVSDGEEDSESDGDNQDEDDGDSIVDEGESTDSQPEWGVDSHDEKEYCSADEDNWSDEEDERKARLYRRNLHFSHGFAHVKYGVAQCCLNLWTVNILRSEEGLSFNNQYAQDMTKLSFRKYNALNPHVVFSVEVDELSSCTSESVIGDAAERARDLPTMSSTSSVFSVSAERSSGSFTTAVSLFLCLLRRCSATATGSVYNTSKLARTTL
ncbi:hypothetical protein Bca101_018892 [Brassica carinata]